MLQAKAYHTKIPCFFLPPTVLLTSDHRHSHFPSQQVSPLSHLRLSLSSPSPSLLQTNLAVKPKLTLALGCRLPAAPGEDGCTEAGRTQVVSCFFDSPLYLYHHFSQSHIRKLAVGLPPARTRLFSLVHLCWQTLHFNAVLLFSLPHPYQHDGYPKKPFFSRVGEKKGGREGVEKRKRISRHDE